MNKPTIIPQFTLDRQNTNIEKELLSAYKSTISSGIFILGKKVKEFEESFAKFIGVKYAVGLASGTDALTLSLLALGIGRGDEVLVPANAYPTAFGVSATGAKPVLVDVHKDTLNINVSNYTKSISRNTKAIIPVHLYGQPADMESVMKFAKKHGLSVIEDCAQAHGAEIRVKSQESRVMNRKVGSIGEMGCFSFYPTKNLGALGDGGLITTNDKKLYEKLLLLRMYGEKDRYNSVLKGRNSRLDELQAAILNVKLKHLNDWTFRRKEIAQRYRLKIENCKLKIRDVKMLFESDFARHVYHLFVIRVKSRKELMEYLKERGVLSAIHYPSPIHFTESYADLGYKKGDFPVSEKASREVVSLPMFPELKDSEVDRVVDVLGSFFT